VYVVVCLCSKYLFLALFCEHCLLSDFHGEVKSPLVEKKAGIKRSYCCKALAHSKPRWFTGSTKVRFDLPFRRLIFLSFTLQGHGRHKQFEFSNILCFRSHPRARQAFFIHMKPPGSAISMKPSKKRLGYPLDSNLALAKFWSFIF
jgi:hypothetical protein